MDAPLAATRYVLGDPDDRWAITLQHRGKGLWSIHDDQSQGNLDTVWHAISKAWVLDSSGSYETFRRSTRFTYDEAVRIAQQLHAKREADRG